jgi:hypothetical protein
MDGFLTFADLKRITGEPVYILDYALRNYAPAPTARIGTTRLWRQDALREIRAALARTAKHSKLPTRRATAAVQEAVR